ncbi:MAG TPA: GntR family transcriptional regulator [Ktedonobacteraceae bacterium]|nr:GntR family transcriptional regulator [Ktedonobacteraceae bacterium]
MSATNREEMRVTTKSVITDLLREDILSGKYRPGQPLIQEELSEHYRVSRIPIREALQHLEGEGLVRAEGKRGLVVTQLDAVEAEDIYLIRMRLEPLALQLAFPNLTKAHIGQAEDLVDAMQVETEAAQRGKLNWAFHKVLYEPAHRPYLLYTLESLHLHADRYMRFQFNVLNNQQQSQHEHVVLLQALREKNVAEAERLLRQHISFAGEQLVLFLKNHLHS